jgi:endoglucanase
MRFAFQDIFSLFLKKVLCRMKKLIILVSVFIFLLDNSQAITSPKKEKFVIKRGTNIAHWLSQSSRRGEERARFITSDDIATIARMGFDHVRLPIDEEQMWDEKGNRNPDAFRLMENCINWCIENKLRVVVDLHILRSHHFNAQVKPLWTDPAEQEKFCRLWVELSAALRKYPDNMVAYELMNEAVADDPEQWNRLIADVMKIIRKIEPDRTIVIGSNKWQSYSTFNELKVPADDKNIILSFHFYEPFLLTHYHASWTNQKNYSGPVHYPGVILTKEEFDKLPDEVKPEVKRWIGKEFNVEVIREMFQKPLAKARSLGLPLYCGEYGAISDAPAPDKLRWYADLISLFRENGIASANWNYKSGNFGLVSWDGAQYEDLIKTLTR